WRACWRTWPATSTEGCSSPRSMATIPRSIRSRRFSWKRGSIRLRWVSKCDAEGTNVPEGDAIFRTARTLNRALAGRTVVRFESVFPKLSRVHDDMPLTGRTIESVTAAGKHVLMRFSGNLLLRTHMRMNGSWHIYRPGERWRKPRRDMRIIVATDAYEAI